MREPPAVDERGCRIDDHRIIGDDTRQHLRATSQCGARRHGAQSSDVAGVDDEDKRELTATNKRAIGKRQRPSCPHL